MKKHDWSNLRGLYLEQNLTRNQIAQVEGVCVSSVDRALRRLGIPLKKPEFFGGFNERVGPESHNWKGGIRKHKEGYVLIYAPGHPRAHKKTKVVLEHILVWEQVHGKSLPEGWVIHHLNGITNDNRPENLIALPDRKHKRVLALKAERIRELEAKVRLLERALDNQQLIFWHDN